MKRTTLLFFCGLIFLTAIYCIENQTDEKATAPSKQLVGEWKMIQRIISSPDGAVLSESDDSDLYMVKAFTENYYFFLISEIQTRKLQTAGGGRYTVDGGVIHQLTEHHSAEVMVGRPTEFDFKIEDGKLFFSGNAGANLFQEVYVRLTGEGDLPYPGLNGRQSEKPTGPMG